jgi:hypothetical protein
MRSWDDTAACILLNILISAWLDFVLQQEVDSNHREGKPDEPTSRHLAIQ